jgi:integrase
MGYCGACRREELTIMSVNDVDFKSDSILVSIPKTKTNKPRLFAITDSEWIDLIKTYHNLRPKNVTHSRFFLTYRNWYCINSPIGINTFGKMPKVIATFLKLPNPELFTGHCFRRSSASHLANRGGDLITIKRHGGWKSSAVAEGYIEQSLKKKVFFFFF